MWQDKVLAICNAVFIVTMLYQVFDNQRRKRCGISLFTSTLTFLTLYIMSFTFNSLNLFWAAGSAFMSATLWAITAIQKMYWRKSA
jgi:lipopolysaccharide export LptBFGC system permease protein LptF